MTKRELSILALLLVIAAALLHLIHYFIFRDAHHIAIYLLGDIAFVPLEVLFVTIIVDRLLAEREQVSRRHKMNMVIGVFFSEIGRPLLRLLRDACADHCLLPELSLNMKTPPQELLNAARNLDARPPVLDPQPQDLAAIRDLYGKQETLLLQLLSNPALLEHEEFADTLWAIQHLGEELQARHDFQQLPPSDRKHLKGDAERACSRLLAQWLLYLRHLQQHYPYLYSFAVRADPLHPDKPVEVTE